MIADMWKDIAGHVSQIELLKSYIITDKLPHAFLFCGPMGLGKTQLAYEFFKAINCLKSRSDPCDACRNCVKADNNSHPDLIIVRATDGLIQVKDIRSVISDIGLKPFEAGTRLVIIEPAERMNKASANAILKTLEEPPQGTVIILVSHKPTMLLPTIVSRCQVIRFTPLDASSCKGISVDPAILRLTSGSIGSLSGLDKDDVLHIRTELVNITRGADPFDLLVKYFPAANQNKDAATTFLLVAESIIRDILVLNHGGEALINEELAEIPVRQISLDALDDLSACIRGIRRGMSENINLKNAMGEMLIMLSDLAAVRL